MGKRVEKVKAKVKKAWNSLGAGELAAIYAGTLAIGGGMAEVGDKLNESAAATKLETINVIEKSAKADSAPKTLSALEEERISATSELIRSRTDEGWALPIAGLGGISAGLFTAVSRIARKKNEPGEEPEKPLDQTPGR